MPPILISVAVTPGVSPAQQGTSIAIMRYVAGAPEHVTDGMARAHRHPRLQPEGRHPGAQLTVQPCLFIVRVVPGASETIMQIAQSPLAHSVDEHIGTAGANRFDAVIHGPRPGS